ncbi:MAG: pyridoxamine 5'-phosphate oxidase [Breznakibacter sp.]
MTKISQLRKDYGQGQLQRPNLDPSPFAQFREWLNEAIDQRVMEPTAMCLSTVDNNGMPHSRVVLLKDLTDNGFTFFTNYLSDKGKQMEQNPKVALNFFWAELERQVRITGVVEKTPEDVSDNYFASRPPASKLGAWASPQSQPVDDKFVAQEFERLSNQMGDQKIKRPPHWGGYQVVPLTFEFWQGRTSRLHDRFRYSINQQGQWHIERLAP